MLQNVFKVNIFSYVLIHCSENAQIVRTKEETRTYKDRDSEELQDHIHQYLHQIIYSTKSSKKSRFRLEKRMNNIDDDLKHPNIDSTSPTELQRYHQN